MAMKRTYSGRVWKEKSGRMPRWWVQRVGRPCSCLDLPGAQQVGTGVGSRLGQVDGAKRAGLWILDRFLSQRRITQGHFTPSWDSTRHLHFYNIFPGDLTPPLRVKPWGMNGVPLSPRSGPVCPPLLSSLGYAWYPHKTKGCGSRKGWIGRLNVILC